MSITWIGLDKVIAKLKSLQAPELISELQKTTHQAVAYVHSQVPPYPAPPAGSTYSRTGTLGRGINTKVKTMGSEVIGIIGSPTPYSPWVISDEAAGGAGPQAWMHQGRWWTLQSVVKNTAAEVVKFFEDMIARLVNR